MTMDADQGMSLVGAACEEARQYLHKLDYLSVEDGRRVADLCYRLRQPSVATLDETMRFLCGIHPAQPGQADAIGYIRSALVRLRHAPREVPSFFEELKKRVDDLRVTRPLTWKQLMDLASRTSL